MGEPLPEKYLKYRNTVYEGAKKIYSAGLVQFGEGNVSARIGKREEMFITPTQNDYASMTPEDIVRITFTGEYPEKSKRASSEYMLHAAVYSARPKAKCAIHSHPVYTTMLAVTGRNLPILIEEMAFLIGGEVRVTDFAPSGTEELGRAVLDAMGNTNAAIIRNHGLFVCARNMDTAVRTTLLIEKMARVYVGALSTGAELKTLTETEVIKWIELFKNMNSTAPRKK